MKPWYLKLHRWLALLFALPLLIVVLTGLVLSFEPWLVTRAIAPGTLPAERVEALLERHDPHGAARAISYRSYDGTLTLGGGRGGGTIVDVGSGETLPAASMLATVMGTARGMHETLLLGAGWLVIASTAAMLAIALLGVLMGWPRIANTLSGWHKVTAWGLLPLLVLSPLTGLLISAGVTFTSPAPAPPAENSPLTLAAAVQVVARDHDLSSLVWLRPQGGRMLARLAENGEYAVYVVTGEGAAAQPRNWPRLWHEGNFAGAWSAVMNAVISVALLGLMVTGTLIWLRRRLRRRSRRREILGATAPTARTSA